MITRYNIGQNGAAAINTGTRDPVTYLTRDV